MFSKMSKLLKPRFSKFLKARSSKSSSSRSSRAVSDLDAVSVGRASITEETMETMIHYVGQHFDGLSEPSRNNLTRFVLFRRGLITFVVKKVPGEDTISFWRKLGDEALERVAVKERLENVARGAFGESLIRSLYQFMKEKNDLGLEESEAIQVGLEKAESLIAEGKREVLHDGTTYNIAWLLEDECLFAHEFGNLEASESVVVDMKYMDSENERAWMRSAAYKRIFEKVDKTTGFRSAKDPFTRNRVHLGADEFKQLLETDGRVYFVDDLFGEAPVVKSVISKVDLMKAIEESRRGVGQ